MTNSKIQKVDFVVEKAVSDIDREVPTSSVTRREHHLLPVPSVDHETQNHSFVQMHPLSPGSEFKEYDGDSDDKIYTWVYTNVNKTHYRCKICHRVNQLGRGPGPIKKHFNGLHSSINIKNAYVSKHKDRKKNNVGPLMRMINRRKLEKYTVRSESQREYVQCLAAWTAMDHRSLNTVEDYGFRNVQAFLNPRYLNVSAKVVRQKILQWNNELEDVLPVFFDAFPVISATTDCWTDERAVSYASLTIHGITSEWKLKSMTVLCRRLTERHTGEALSKFLVNALRSYGILDKTVSVTVDNATNAVAMMRITGEEFAELVYCEHAAVEDATHAGEVTGRDDGEADHAMDAEKFPPAPTSTEDILSDEPEDILEEFLNLETPKAPMPDMSNLVGAVDKIFSTGDILVDNANCTEPTAQSDEAKIVQCNLNRIPCVAHTLQLSIKSALSSEAVKSSISSVREISKFFRKTPQAWTDLETAQRDRIARERAFNPKKRREQPVRPVLDVATRWGSTLSMLVRYTRIRADVDTAVLSLSAKSVKTCDVLSATQQVSVASCIDVLKLAETATTSLGCHKTTTSNMRDVLLSGLLVHCSRTMASSVPGTVAYELSSNIHADVTTRMKKTAEKLPMFALFCHVACFLDPRFFDMKHKAGIPGTGLSEEEAVERLGNIALKVLPGWGLNDTAEPSVTASDSYTDTTGTERLIAYAVGGAAPQPLPRDWRTRLREEVCQYRLIAAGSNDDDPLLFWKRAAVRLPLLSGVARIALTPPVTSTASERLFSIAGVVRSKRRSRLTPEMTEALIRVGAHLRSNRDM